MCTLKPPILPLNDYAWQKEKMIEKYDETIRCDALSACACIHSLYVAYSK